MLEQASFREPFTERFDILVQLTKSFPSEAQFKAHLGRLYTICRPEKEKEAEQCLKEALEMCLSQTEGVDIDEIPYSSKLDLMHIYHMYGNMLLRRLSRYTGVYIGDQPVPRRQTENFEDLLPQILPVVKKACGYFTESRNITPIGNESSMGYICEIQVRLLFATFVNSKGSCKHVVEYMECNDTESAEFLRDSCAIIDELFLECFSVVEPDRMDNNVLICQEMHLNLFEGMSVPGKVILRQSDDVKSRQFQVARIKMKYIVGNHTCLLENVQSSCDIHTIVESYEKNFEVYESEEGLPVPKRTADMEYKEWMYAIRHNFFHTNYAIDCVLKRVESWFETLKTPHSRFYLFVLKSMIGFGADGRDGNVQLLLESQRLREEVIKYSKQVTRPKYPREWLGQPCDDIRWLCPGLRFFGQIENRKIAEHDLEIRRGTIRPPNDKPSGGFIDLYLGPRNRTQVKVFFVPARADGHLSRSLNKDARVEFVIGFSMFHGYEAFNVKELGTITCTSCNIEVEIRSNERKVKCPRCSKLLSRERANGRSKKLAQQ